jgi:hypothetical protein
MLIRSEQMKSLSAVMRNDFAARMAAHLRDAFSDVVDIYTAQDLETKCRSWALRAEAAGFQSEEEAESFIELCTCHAEIGAAEPAPWVSKILDTPDDSGAKLARLRENAVFASVNPS